MQAVPYATPSLLQILRPVGNVCEELDGHNTQAVDINAGMDGAWFDWLTAQGSFEGPIAEIDVFETTGGSFVDPQEPSTIKVGTMSLDFTDCSNAQLTYSLTDSGAEGDIAITRVIPEGKALCEELMGAD